VHEPRPALTPTLRRLAVVSVAALTLAIPGTGSASKTTPRVNTAAATRTANATAQSSAAGAASKVASGVLAVTTATNRAAAAQAAKAKAAEAKAAKAKAAKARVAKARAAARARKLLVPLSGHLGNGTIFPSRALVLSGPRGLTASRIHLSENGAAVGSFSVTPVSHAAAGDFGVMLVIDQSSSMAGAPLKATMAAARSFTALSSGAQELGLITFNGSANLIQPLTTDRGSMNAVLAGTPWTGPGADVPAANQLALTDLAKARVALGAIILISDGVGNLTSTGGPTPTSVQAAAAAAHVPIFTVGLQDQLSSAAALQALAAAAPGGQFVASSPARLTSVLHAISAMLTSDYVVRYRSTQRPNAPVTVTATADGIPGTLDVAYRTPPTVGRAAAAQSHRHAQIDLAQITQLSSLPSFAAQNGSPAAPVAPAQSTSFWNSSASILIVAGISGLLIVMAIALAFHRPAKRAVRTRVGSFIPGSDIAGEGDSLGSPQRARGLGGLLERGNWWLPFVEDVEIARSAHTPVQLVKRAAIMGVVVAILVTIVSGSVLFGIVPLLLWPIPLKMLIARAARKQRELFVDSLPGYLQDLASALRVGRSFASGLGIIAGNADEPVRSELERAVADEALGRPLDESLVAVGKRMRSTDTDQVALIAALNRRSGSNVAEALDRVAEGARERADMRREAKALTGQAKMSSWVLTALPPLLLIFISFISPLYAHPLFHTTIGIALLIMCGLMVFAGWKVMKKITTIKA
jgi:tight adherence protein B